MGDAGGGHGLAEAEPDMGGQVAEEGTSVTEQDRSLAWCGRMRARAVERFGVVVGGAAGDVVNADGALSALSSFATGQAGTCWIAASGDLLFASNAGSANETGLRLGAGASLTGLGNTATVAGTVVAAAGPDGRNLYVQTGGSGVVDAYTIAADGALTEIGSVTVPGGIGGEGITVG